MRIRYAVPIVLVTLLAGCSSGSATGTVGSPAAAGNGSSAAAGAGSSAASDAAGASDAAAGASGAAAGSGPGAGLGDARPGPATSGTLDGAVLATHLKNAVAAKQTTAMRMTTTGLVAGGVLRYGDDVSMSMAMTAGTQKLKVVIVGGIYYLDLGQKVNGKTWVKLNPKGTDAMASLVDSLKQLTDLGSAPASYRGVVATAKAGPVLDGVPTFVYSFRLNTKQMIATLPAFLRKTVLAGDSSKTTFYLDADWLPHKVVVAGTSKGRTVTTTISYSKWGDPVTIVAPPAAQVGKAIGA